MTCRVNISGGVTTPYTRKKSRRNLPGDKIFTFRVHVAYSAKDHPKTYIEIFCVIAMADQGRSELHVVTTILCGTNFFIW